MAQSSRVTSRLNTNSQAQDFPAEVISTQAAAGSDNLGIKTLLKLTLFLWELCKQTQAILFLMLMTDISFTH